MQRRAFNDVVGVDARIMRPIESRQVGLAPRGEEHDALDAAGFEDGIEAGHGDGAASHDNFFDLEAEGGSAGFGTEHEFVVKMGGGRGAVRLIEIHGRQHAAKRAAP